jgi:hypothetical protein
MRKKIVKISLFVFGSILVLCVCVYYSPYKPLLPGYHSLYYTPAEYHKILERWPKGGEHVETDSLRNRMVRELFPFWYGTRWSFYGTTETPGEGKIACGYFVTTLLSHAGLALNRTKLACCASEKMIQALLEEKYIERYHNTPIEDFVQKLGKAKAQLYIVGLDNHTGFLAAADGQWYFIHASGRFPFSVVKEQAINSTALVKSKYRVLGKLTDAAHISLDSID